MTPEHRADLLARNRAQLEDLKIQDQSLVEELAATYDTLVKAKDVHTQRLVDETETLADNMDDDLTRSLVLNRISFEHDKIDKCRSVIRTVALQLQDAARDQYESSLADSIVTIVGDTTYRETGGYP